MQAIDAFCLNNPHLFDNEKYILYHGYDLKLFFAADIDPKTAHKYVWTRAFKNLPMMKCAKLFAILGIDYYIAELDKDVSRINEVIKLLRLGEYPGDNGPIRLKMIEKITMEATVGGWNISFQLSTPHVENAPIPCGDPLYIMDTPGEHESAMGAVVNFDAISTRNEFALIYGADPAPMSRSIDGTSRLRLVSYSAFNART